MFQDILYSIMWLWLRQTIDSSHNILFFNIRE